MPARPPRSRSWWTRLAGSRSQIAGQGAPKATVPSDARRCRSCRRARMARSRAPAASDRLAPSRCARLPAARQPPRPHARMCGGEVSWPPSLQCGRRDALFRLDIGRADYLRPLGGIRLDDDSKFLRRIEGYLKTELRDPLAHVSLHGDLHDVRMHLADDGGWRAGWR